MVDRLSMARMALLATAAALIAAPREILADALLRVDFKDNPAAPYDDAMARADFGDMVQFSKIQAGRARIKEDAATGQKVLEVKYPKGCLGSSECAIQLRTFFPAQETAWVRYKVRFEPGFSWQRGGKLPGLCGGKCNTGCVGVTGEDGWSARMMWRGAGMLVQYMYVPGKSSSCGDDYGWNMQAAVPGRWYELKNQIILNTPGTGGGNGKGDGVMRSWLDGKLVLDRGNVRFRDAAALKIDQFYFSTFHGGSSDAWRPSVDSYISFSDIVVANTDPSDLSSSISMRAETPRRTRAAWRNGILAFHAPRSGTTSIKVADLRGLAVASLETAGPVSHPLALRPGVYLVSWSGAAGTGNQRLSVL